MSPTFRRLIVLCAAALIAVASTGCSKKNNPVGPVIPDLTQEQADDMIQQVAMMMASDHGGWMVDLQSTREAMPLGGPPLAANSLSRRLLLMPASSGGGFRTNRDTLVTRGSMNYQFNYLYTDTASIDSIVDYNPAVIQVDVVSLATGTISVTGFNGSFRHLGDPLTVTGFHAGSDSIHFSGIGDDSLFVTFTPVFRGGTRYSSLVSFVDLEIIMLRDPASNPFPIGGVAFADLFFEVLRTADPNDIFDTLDGIVTIHFDGTETPLVDITNDFDAVTPQFRYRANLTTGAITRVL